MSQSTLVVESLFQGTEYQMTTAGSQAAKVMVLRLRDTHSGLAAALTLTEEQEAVMSALFQHGAAPRAEPAQPVLVPSEAGMEEDLLDSHVERPDSATFEDVELAEEQTEGPFRVLVESDEEAIMM